MSTTEGVDLPVLAQLVVWKSGGEEWVQAHASDLPAFDQARRYGVEPVPLTDHAAALSRIRSLQQEVDATYKAWCGRDYMHLPLPDAVGAVIGTDRDRIAALQQEVERLHTGIGEVAMRLSKDKDYRLRAAEALLALLPDSGPTVAPGGQPSEMSGSSKTEFNPPTPTGDEA